MKKYTLIIIFALLSFISFAAFYALNVRPVEDLIQPPEQYESGGNIREALSSEVGNNYILKLPQNGEYRSAFIYNDLDADEKEEAVVFCSKNNASDRIIMLVFKYEDDDWKKTSYLESDFTVVKEVKFSDLDHDGIHEIIVGWSSLGSELLQKLSVYKPFSGDEKVKSIFESTYSNFTICDINTDDEDEIILLSKNKHSTNYVADLFQFQGSRFVKTQSFDIDPMISSISSVNSDYIKRNSVSRLYIDGCTADGRIVTDLLSWDRDTDRLKRITIGNKSLCAYSARTINFLCEDVNKDGILDIPIQPNESDRVYGNRVICWVSLLNDTIKEIYYYLNNSEAGYYFRMSKKDFQSCKFQLDAENSNLLVFENKSGKLLFELIKTSQKNNSENLKSYKYLSSSKNYDFYYKVTPIGTLKGITKKYITENIFFY